MTALSKSKTDAALKAVKAIEANKVTVAEVLTEIFAPKTKGQHAEAPTTLRVTAMTEAHQKALSRLPEVYGKVTPEVPRMLTEDELATIVEEREIIDTVLSLIDKRKKESIREALAYHMDRTALAEDKVKKGDPTDAKGHYYIRQEIPVEGLGKKVQQIVSDPKASVDSRMLASLEEDGTLTREEYLALTSVPEVPRVFDEAKARKAIRKNPELMVKLAQAVTRSNPTITIKVADDK